MKILIVFALSLLLASCSLFWEYRGLEEFENLSWRKSDVKTFNASIKNDGDYDVYILLRHATGFHYANVGIRMSVDNDSAKLYEIPIINESTREYLGEGSGDLWDVEYKAISKAHLAAGNYQFKLQHAMIDDNLKLAMEVGIMIRKSE